MFNFKNNEGVKNSNDLHESGKKIVAKTNEKVFEHLLLNGEEPQSKLLPVVDCFEEVVNDGCYHQKNAIAVKVATDVSWSHKHEVAALLMNDKTFFGRAAYLDDCMHLVWVIQKTNNLPLMHWKIAIENYLNKHHGLGCSFQDLTAEEYLYDSIEIQFYLCKFQPITHIEYFTYEHGEQNAHHEQGLNKFDATFSDKIKVEDLPPSLVPIYNSVQGAGHKDKMLLASLTRISGLITNLYGLYRRQRLYGNLMTLQFAPPAVSRKGEVKETAHLTDKVDNEQLLENEAIMREYSSIVDSCQQEGRTAKGRDTRGLKPKEPAIRRFKIAAKSTSASMYKQLSANDGAGYMMTTEGEVLVKELTKDISDFSELLLYSFQNEFADKSIATDNTHYSMPRIKFSVLLTMPPQAAEKLIKLTLDKGLISRLIIQQLPTNKLEWEDPFAEDGEPLEDIFKQTGDTMVYVIYKEMQRLKDKEIQFVMTPEQKQDFSNTFKEQFEENTQLFGVTFSEFQFRLGVICFKLAMVLSMIKKYDEAADKCKLFGDDEQSLLCSDVIYNIAKIITITMTRHTLRCYQIVGMKEQQNSLMQDYRMSPQNALLYEEMAENFSSEDVKAWCSEHNASYDTARRWLRNMLDHQLLSRLSPGKFRKIKAA